MALQEGHYAKANRPDKDMCTLNLALLCLSEALERQQTPPRLTTVEWAGAELLQRGRSILQNDRKVLMEAGSKYIGGCGVFCWGWGNDTHCSA